MRRGKKIWSKGGVSEKQRAIKVVKQRSQCNAALMWFEKGSRVSEESSLIDSLGKYEASRALLKEATERRKESED